MFNEHELIKNYIILYEIKTSTCNQPKSHDLVCLHSTAVMYMLQLIFVFLLFLGMVCMLMNFKQTKNKT